MINQAAKSLIERQRAFEPLEKTEIRARAVKLLAGEGIHCAADLCFFSDKELLAIDKFGDTCLWHVKKCIEKFGLVEIRETLLKSADICDRYKDQIIRKEKGFDTLIARLLATRGFLENIDAAPVNKSDLRSHWNAAINGEWIAAVLPTAMRMAIRTDFLTDMAGRTRLADQVSSAVKNHISDKLKSGAASSVAANENAGPVSNPALEQWIESSIDPKMKSALQEEFVRAVARDKDLQDRIVTIATAALTRDLGVEINPDLAA